MRRLGVLVSVGLVLLPFLVSLPRTARAQVSPPVKPFSPATDLDLPPEDRTGNRGPAVFRCPFCGFPTTARVTQVAQCSRCARMGPPAKPPSPSPSVRVPAAANLDLPPEDRPGVSSPAGSTPLRSLPPELQGEAGAGTSALPGSASGKKGTAAASGWSRTFVLISAGALMLVALAYGVARRGGARPSSGFFGWGGAGKEPTYVCRCPRCKGKTRYAEHQSGHRTKCTRCGWYYPLPAITSKECLAE